MTRTVGELLDIAHQSEDNSRAIAYRLAQGKGGLKRLGDVDRAEARAKRYRAAAAFLRGKLEFERLGYRIREQWPGTVKSVLVVEYKGKGRYITRAELAAAARHSDTTGCLYYYLLCRYDGVRFPEIEG